MRLIGRVFALDRPGWFAANRPCDVRLIGRAKHPHTGGERQKRQHTSQFDRPCERFGNIIGWFFHFKPGELTLDDCFNLNRSTFYA